jgi:phosphatidylglycerophosphate synthase
LKQITTGTGQDGSTAAAARREAPKRPRELQDGLNYHLYHPLAWRLALLLAKTPITPNVVSVISGCFVVAAGIVYALTFVHGWGVPGALLGLALHMTWHVVDGADGDLARLTGRTSPLGELVDGVCDYASHIIVYFILGWVLAQQIGSVWAWPIMVAAGVSHFVQANHVEVQRRQYQWWVYGTPWIRHSHGNSDAATRKSMFGGIVTFYLALAAGMTPHARVIDEALSGAQSDSQRERVRAVARREAAPLLPLLKLLGPNPRALVLGLSMLAGSPLWYFLYQAVFLNLLLAASVILHNRAARRMADRISA